MYYKYINVIDCHILNEEVIDMKKKTIFSLVLIFIFCISLAAPAYAATDYYVAAHDWYGYTDASMITMTSTESAGYDFIKQNGDKGEVRWMNSSGTLYGVVLDGLTIDFSYSYVIQNGSTGSKVSAVQKALQYLGYSVTVDGVFGTQTKNAVEAFQSFHSLPVDGIVGSQTYAMLAVASN